MTASAAGTLDAPGKTVQQKVGLNRELLDTAPARLLDLISYKVQETGGWFLERQPNSLSRRSVAPGAGTCARVFPSARIGAPNGFTKPRDDASAHIFYARLLQELAGCVRTRLASSAWKFQQTREK